MSRLRTLFQPAPHVPELQDPVQIKKEYDYWRWRIFYSMFFGYAFYYLTRKSFVYAIPVLSQDLGYDKGELGLISTIWALAYGMSKFFSGILSDHSNARYFMSFGLIMTGICNILFGLSSSLWLFILFWGLNGWFQGFGWPPCARLLTHWYSRSERGSWWSSWNVCHNVGGALIPLVAGVSAGYYNWRFALYIPGIVCIVMGFWLMERLRDTPRSLGLPSIEHYRHEYVGASEKEDDQEITGRQIVWDYVLTNPYVWVLACASFFVHVIRGGVDWTATFLVETRGYSLLTANSCVSLFEVGGFVGSLLAGWSSDYFFSARRLPVIVLFSIGIFLSVLLLWYIPKGFIVLDSTAMFFLGMMVFGPQMMIGMAAVEMTHKKAAATVTGFAGWFAYAGTAAAGYPLGRIMDAYSWQAFFIVMTACGLLTLALLIPLWAIDRTESPVVPSSAASN